MPLSFLRVNSLVTLWDLWQVPPLRNLLRKASDKKQSVDEITPLAYKMPECMATHECDSISIPRKSPFSWPIMLKNPWFISSCSLILID